MSTRIEKIEEGLSDLAGFHQYNLLTFQGISNYTKSFFSVIIHPAALPIRGLNL
jgi:hypothetical protein